MGEKKKATIIKRKRKRKTIDFQIDQLDSQKKTFRHVRTSHTDRIILDKGKQYLYTDDDKKIQDSDDFKFLGMMAKLKKLVKEREANIYREDIGYEFNTVQYFDFCENIRRMEYFFNQSVAYFDCMEADITKAYYQAAKVLELIPESFAEECLTLPKSHRLKLIGSMATVSIVKFHAGGKVIERQVRKDDVLRAAWFLICNYVSKAMNEFKAALKDNFLFYWVDGIYFQSTAEAEQIALDVGLKYGFVFDFQRIKKIEVVNNIKDVKVHVFKVGGKKTVFSPNLSGKKRKILINFGELLNTKSTDLI